MAGTRGSPQFGDRPLGGGVGCGRGVVEDRLGVVASVGGQAATPFRDLIPLSVVPVEAAGAVLWVSDAADTSADVSGRIVATPLLARLSCTRTW